MMLGGGVLGCTSGSSGTPQIIIQDLFTGDGFIFLYERSPDTISNGDFWHIISGNIRVTGGDLSGTASAEYNLGYIDPGVSNCIIETSLLNHANGWCGMIIRANGSIACVVVPVGSLGRIDIYAISMSSSPNFTLLGSVTLQTPLTSDVIYPMTLALTGDNLDINYGGQLASFILDPTYTNNTKFGYYSHWNISGTHFSQDFTVIG